MQIFWLWEEARDPRQWGSSRKFNKLLIDTSRKTSHTGRAEFTCVMGDSEGDMVGDSCLARLRRCSLLPPPGDSVSGLMGGGRRRGELLTRRRDELMEGLLRDDCSWQLLRDAWMDGLLSEEDRPAGGSAGRGLNSRKKVARRKNTGSCDEVFQAESPNRLAL